MSIGKTRMLQTWRNKTNMGHRIYLLTNTDMHFTRKFNQIATVRTKLCRPQGLTNKIRIISISIDCKHHYQRIISNYRIYLHLPFIFLFYIYLYFH